MNKYFVHYILLIIFINQFGKLMFLTECGSDIKIDCYKDDSINGYFYVYSDIEEQSGAISNDIKNPQVILTKNCINKLKIGLVDKGIAVGRKFTIAPNNEITDIICYKFYYYDETTNELDTDDDIDIQALCGNEAITYYLPIINNDNSLLNKYINVVRQNPDSDEEDTFLDYDIFNPEADFYNDICATFTYSEASENTDDSDEFVNYDVTLHERRKYYYPGSIALCPKGFTYKGIDKETFSAICQTTVSSETSRIIDIENDPIPDPHDFTSFKAADSDFKKEKRDIYFSMDVFKCIKLPFTYRGFKGNYGSYFMIALMIIVVICYLILLIAGKIHLLSVLELLYNSNIQSMNYLKQNNNMYNNSLTNNNNQIISYDVRSNNNQTLA